MRRKLTAIGRLVKAGRGWPYPANAWPARRLGRADLYRQRREWAVEVLQDAALARGDLPRPGLTADTLTPDEYRTARATARAWGHE